jgi:hypothetical protein
MAFISTYERLVREARNDAKPVEWILSLGFSPDRRAEAIQKAVQLGRIPQDRASTYTRAIGMDAPTGTVAAVAGLLTGQVVKPKAEDKEKFMTLKDRLKQEAERMAALTPEERRAEHEKRLSEHNKIIKDIE